MTSFTDTTVPFNPYIAQNPVDVYARVGMQEQEDYKKGVEKVQGYIDSIGGLDIAHPEQQAYVQQRLDQLKGEVTKVISADFSKDQLINQVGSLTATIANDPIVRNAVNSTAVYKNELGKMQKAQTDGKSNIANEWDFSQQVGSWLGNKDVKATFNGQYTPYTDIRKKSLEILKELKPDANITDNAFTVDKDGKMVLSDAIVREQFKGISPQKIKSALSTAFDQNDYRQMEIEGRYSYSNKDPKALQGIVEKKINGELQDIASKKTILINTKSGLSSVTEKNTIDDKLKALDDQEKSIYKEGDSYKQQLLSNPEAVKAQLYTNQFIGGMANAFSYTELSNEYKDNPLAEMQIKRETLNQQYSEFKSKNEQWLADYKLKLAEYQLKADKQKKEGGGGGYGGVTLTVGQDELQGVSMGKLVQQTDDLQGQLKLGENSFLTMQGKDKAWLNQQEQLYNQGKQISPLVENYFKNKEGIQAKTQQNQELIKQISDKADRDPAMNLSTLVPKDAPDLVVTDGIGRKVTISPQEIIDFNSKIWKYEYTAPVQGAKGELNDADAMRELNSKEKLLYHAYKKNFYHEYDSMTPADHALIDNITHYYGTVNMKSPSIIKKRQEFMDTELANRTGESVRTAYDIPAGKAEERYAATNIANQFINNAKDQKESFGSGPNSDYNVIKGLVGDKNEKSTTYSLVVKDKTQFGEPKYWIRVSNAENKKQFGDIPITTEQKTQIFGSQYENSVDNSGFRDVKQQIMMTGGASTNFNFGNEALAPSTAYLNKNDFQGIGKFSVKGDIVQQNGGYALRMYVYDPTTKKTQSIDYAPNAGLMDESSALSAVKQMNDGAIFQLLYGRVPTADDFKKIEELNKKPF